MRNVAILLAIVVLFLGPLAMQDLLVSIYLLFANLPARSVAVIVGVPGAIIIGYHVVRPWLAKHRFTREAHPYLPNPRDRKS